ncbi:hypothetical protein BaRGS_00039603, partial [Batillaria attramentaria]
MASSASLSAASAAKVRCVIHFSATNEDEAICALTETTFDRILDFSNKWKRLVGAQGDVARVFRRRNICSHVAVCMRLLTQVLDFTTDSLTQPGFTELKEGLQGMCLCCTQSQRIAALEQEVVDTQKHFQTAKDDVVLTFGRLKEMLEKRCQEFITTLQSQEDKLISGKKAEKPQLDQQRAAISTQARSLDQLLASSPDSALVGMLNKLKQRLASLERQPHARKQQEGGLSKVKFDTQKMASLQREIAALGWVVNENLQKAAQDVLVLNSFVHIINELRQEVSDAQAHFAAMRQEVNATCDRLQQTVERKRTELNNAIRQQEECFLSPIEDEKSFLEEHRASLAAHAVIGEHLLDISSNTTLLGTLKRLKARLDNLESRARPPRRAQTSPPWTLSMDEDLLSYLEQSIGEVGHVLFDSDPSASAGEQPGTVIHVGQGTGYKGAGWVLVRWDKSGRAKWQRHGGGGKYESHDTGPRQQPHNPVLRKYTPIAVSDPRQPRLTGFTRRIHDQKERAALTDQSQRLEEKEAAILAEVSALEKEIADAKKHFASTEDDINTTFDRLQKTLENRRLEIIESIQVQQEKFLTAKKAEKPPLDQQQADVATMRSLAQHLVTLPDSAFVSTLAKVKKRLDSLEAKSPERHAETCGLSKVTFDTEDQADLESSIASFGHVETDSPAPNTDEMEELHEISKPPDGPFGPVTIGVSGSAAGFGWRPFSGSVLTTTNTTTSHGKGFALTGLTRSPFGFGQPTTSTGTLSAVSSNPVSTGFTGSPFGFGQPTTSTGTLSAVSSNPVSTGFTGSPFGFGQPTTSTGTLYGVSSNPLSTGFTGSPFGFGQPTTSTGTLSFMSSGVYVDGFIVGGGTTVKFNPPSGLDTMSKSGVTTSINTRHQCITAMKEYENKSLE